MAKVVNFGPNAPAWLSLGWIIALIVLVLGIVFYFSGGLDPQKTLLLIIGLALAILL